MRVPVSWLSEYCDPGWSPSETAERLSMSGTEVERVDESVAIPEEGIVVGLVTSVEDHPDADRLRVCAVDVGGATHTIVCGAPNVAVGQSVVVALPGSVLPDGTKLAKAKLRGIVSEGMILSAAELGVGSDDDGIMVLPGDPDPGTPVGQVLAGPEAALELEVTTNRPDCLSVYGVARELHAVSGAPLAEPPWEQDEQSRGRSDATELATVEVEVPEFCPRFTARVFTEVEVADSPDWLADALLAAGQRPINNVVDVTNWVMLLTGQPLHAFDLDRLEGASLTVRLAREGESLETIDGESREIPPGALTIADSQSPVSIAGIMGGAGSEVGEGTSRVLLESACWDGASILRSSRDLSLRTEASARFEKGLHPELAIRAQRVASRLIVELCGAAMAPGTIDIGGPSASPREVDLRVSHVVDLTGMEVSEQECRDRLTRLGFGVEPTEQSGVLRCQVPAERDGDVRREVDLIEEVARLGSLDSELPATLPEVGDGRIGNLSRDQLLQRRAEDLLCDLGGREVVSWSFHGDEVKDLLRLDDGDPQANPVSVSNPLSEDQVVMRTSLTHGLLQAAGLNLAHGASRVFLFESGRIYLPGGPNLESGEGALAGRFDGEREAPALEPHHIGAVLAGGELQGWRDTLRAPDFFQAKSVVESLGRSLGCELGFSPLEVGWLRPGRAARVLTDAGESGWLGEVDPRVCESYGLPVTSAVFEISLGSLVAASSAGEETFVDYPLQPAVYEDFAVIVGEAVAADVLSGAIASSGGDLVEAVEVFDLYRSDDLEPGTKSLALRVTLRAADRTLSEDEIAEARAAIVEGLGGVGAKTRG